MSDAQIFQVLGLAYFCVGLGAMLRPEGFRKLLEDFMSNSGLVYLGGFMALGLGYILVAYHNVWSGGWTVVITVVGWIALIKGVTLLIAPQLYQSLSRWWLQRSKTAFVQGVLITIIGAGMLVLGFFVV